MEMTNFLMFLHCYAQYSYHVTYKLLDISITFCIFVLQNKKKKFSHYMEDFIHLHVHTYYSILDGQSPVQKIVDKAVANGMRGMAITDHGNMFGVKELYNYCNKINGKLKDEGKEPFKPIFGCEMYVAHRRKSDRVKEKGDMGGYHLIVLAKNYKGYKNLIKLVSRAWVDGYYMRPRTDREDLEKYHEDLIVCSACIAGEVPSKILKGDMAGAREALEWYKRVFGDDYYLELQRHEVKDPHQRANRETFPLQQRANKELISLAHEYGIKLVCTNDCHFVDQENAEAHDHLLCLATGKDLDDPNRMLYSKQEWFKTREEMNAIFSDVPEALSNTLEILDKVEFYSIDHAPIMPFFPIPKEFGTEEETRKRISPEQLFREFTTDENGNEIMSHEDAEKKIKKLGGLDKLYRIKFEADYLAKLAYDGAKKLYGDPLTDEVHERIKFELHIMKTMGFPGYFLIVQDFINSARDELGVMVGPGRGSAAGSVVAYCLGITKIDPIKYDLLFERFLNPDRISLPDIDTDFDDDGRGKVLEWVEDKYGHDKVAHIITYGTMATKNSIKDVARVEKLPLDVSNRLCKAIPDKLPDGLKMNLPNAIKCVPELRDAEASANPLLANTIKYAKMLEGTVRGTGIHACGTIICRDAISEWVPVSTAEDKSDPGHKLLATQYDGHVIEETGLIKMDFLGLSTLSIMKETVENIRLTQGFTLDLDTIPIDDELTYKLYQEGRTIGTFQFESAGMQKYLRELRPTVFEGCGIAVADRIYNVNPITGVVSVTSATNGNTVTLPYSTRHTYTANRQYVNGSPVTRYGLEWVAETPIISNRHTFGLSLRLDGKYYHYRGIDNTLIAGSPNGIGDQAEGSNVQPLIGYYVGSNVTSASTASTPSVSNGILDKGCSLNTTLTARIPRLRLIMTMRLEATLLNYRRNLSSNRTTIALNEAGDITGTKYTGQTDHYVAVYPEYYSTWDNPSERIPFAEALMAAKDSDPNLYRQLSNLIVRSNTAYYFNPQDVSTYYSVNFSVTKEIGRWVSLSFYANNFLNNMASVRNSQTGLKTSLFDSGYIPRFYYGASVRVKL
jgi:DNA-directed DNA polymerase III PolC